MSRPDAVDGFVDAMVAWENLFPDGQGGIAFRISTAMASLLSIDLDERLRLQREIDTLYGRRSAVLHGGKASLEQAARERDRAVSLALAALRRLYWDSPDLISDKERTKKIVLSP